MILIYDVNDGSWESKGNFQTATENNDEIDIQPTDNGKYNLDILCVSLPSIYIIISGLKISSHSSIPRSLYWRFPQLLSITAHFHFRQKQLLFPSRQVLVLRLVLLLPCTHILNLFLPLLEKSHLLFKILLHPTKSNLSRSWISLRVSLAKFQENDFAISGNGIKLAGGYYKVEQDEEKANQEVHY